MATHKTDTEHFTLQRSGDFVEPRAGERKANSTPGVTRRPKWCLTTRRAGRPVRSLLGVMLPTLAGSITLATTSTSGAPIGTTRAIMLARLSAIPRARLTAVAGPPAEAPGGITSR